MVLKTLLVLEVMVLGNNKDTSNYMKQLRLIVLDMYKDGVVLDTPIGKYIRKEMDESRVKLLVRLTELLMLTDYIGEESKVYLSIPYINYEGIVDEVYINSGKITNVNAVQSKIWYDKEKIVKEFGDSMPIDILEYTNRDVKEYLDKVHNVWLKVEGKDILKNVSLKFDDETEYCDDITDDEFEDFIAMIAPYTKKVRERVENSIDKHVLGYIRYISTRKDLSDTDRERYNELRKFVG